jgi:HAD superfamily phosphatase (TIGR01668 family)
MRRSVTKLDYKTWKRRGITCLLLDIEGTITPWNSEEISQDVTDTFAAARAAGISDIALISNIPERDEYRVQNICKKIGVNNYWIPRRSGDRKPAPTMLRYAMEHFETEPNHVAYVGDKFVDVVAGRRAGVAEIVWVRRLGRSDHPLDYWLYRPLEPIIRQFVSWFKI